MTTDSYVQSEFYMEFQSGINIIKDKETDPFHYALYFSYAVTLMEKYLQDVFLYEIKNSRENLVRLATHPKFNSQSVKIPFVLNNSIENYLIDSMKKIVWHRLNDVDVFFKQVLNIKFNLSGELITKLEIRHHIVHRNSYDMDGNLINITSNDLEECIKAISIFVLDVDKKYVAR